MTKMEMVKAVRCNSQLMPASILSAHNSSSVYASYLVAWNNMIAFLH